MTEIKMSNIIKRCYIGFLRDNMLTEIQEKCVCGVCKFRRLYRVKR